MNDDTVRLSMIGRVFRRRWRLLLVCTVLGALVGVACSMLFSPGYEAKANVLLQGPREPDEVLTQAQVATSSAVLDKAAKDLRWGLSGADLEDSVKAAVDEGNIIQITAYATTPERAKQLADRVANEFVGYAVQLLNDTTDPTTRVSQEQQQSLRQQVSDTNRRITELHASAGKGKTIDSVGVRTELESLRTTLAEALTRIDELDAAASQAKMVVMAPAERPTGPAAPTMVHFVAGGAALLLLLGVFGHLFAARNDRRLRGEDQIAAAVGSSLVGGIDVPEDPAGTREHGPGARLRRLLGSQRPWYLADLPPAGDEAGLDIRYRRVLSRLRESAQDGAPRVLVVVPKDDTLAHRAANRLVHTADADGVRERLRVVQTPVERPVVPDDDEVAGVLMVITAGTRTGWELVELTEACADAGHDVLGVLVAHRARPRVPDRPTEAPRQNRAETVLAGTP